MSLFREWLNLKEKNELLAEEVLRLGEQIYNDNMSAQIEIEMEQVAAARADNFARAKNEEVIGLESSVRNLRKTLSEEREAAARARVEYARELAEFLEPVVKASKLIATINA